MKRDSASDPWDEVEGLPWEVKEYRTPPGEERSWQTTLHEMIRLIGWLSMDMLDWTETMHLGFDGYVVKNIAYRRKPNPRGEFRVFEHIRKHVEGRIEVHRAVQKLLLRLSGKLDDELMDALQASQSGLDE